MNSKEYGYNDFFAAQFAALELPEQLIPGRVTAVFKHVMRVVSTDGEHLAKTKSSSFRDAMRTDWPAIGDFVALESHPSDTSLIHAVLERKSIFLRDDPDPDMPPQVVAANFDYCFLVNSANDDFNINRLERYLTVAWNSGATPVIVLTKADLSDKLSYYMDQLNAAAFGVPVFAVDSISGTGLDELRSLLSPGETIVLLGSSGVGKSSLVNALAGEERMKTSGIREDDARGRHTTTHREMHLLPSGVIVIDTPGMRALGIGNAAAGLEETFQDIEEIAQHCRFGDCSHHNEPDCAVQDALENGTLARKHYANWEKLRKELAYNERKNNILLMRQDKQQWKAISKQHRAKPKKKV
ncbi:ribosome small subunit-dependent GTPase A [Paenibacillus shenyangensis]|uniref:ribosome small subunit-dependent GTPase A n=1 Tax=Paenibacillus sp. A9 TaxID=1284352 RepID=UPI0003662901|nr:ribosome small subunit-dependent GTPase A [Paenibacillus sp. A9]